MRRAGAALAGAGFGLFSAGIAHVLASCFWPLAALGLQRAALVAGGIAALAAGFAPAAWGERLRRRLGRLALAGAVAAVAVVAATGMLAQRLQPAAGLDLFSFPVLYLAAFVIPFAVAGSALALWCDAAGRQCRGWFVAGIGSGMLCAALPALVSGAAPWTGERFLELSAGEDGATEIGIDRGLRTVQVVPEETAPARSPDGDGMRDILVVGLANGRMLARLLGDPRARITILEDDETFTRAVLSRWPALAESRAAGRLSIVGGAGHWALARLPGRFDLIVVGEGWSEAAYRSRTLSHRRDYRWTVEAFSACLARLKPQGLLLVQRTGIPRAVAILREASGLPAAEFGRRVIVFGRGGGVGAECWYSPAGFDSRKVRRTLRRHGRSTGFRALYTPQDTPPGRNFYLPLIRGERVRGLAFSTPLDLSPPLETRPFFDHGERLMLSPRLPGMPEELAPLAGPSRLRILPAADRTLWGILLGGIALSAAAVALGVRAARRGGAPVESTLRFLPDALGRGAAAGLLIEAFSAWSGWLAPTSLAAAAALAALLAGLGAGWARTPAIPCRRQGCAAAAALALLCGAAGYRALPLATRLGPTFVTVAMIGAGALLGAALGRAIGAGSGDVAAADGGFCGAGLAAASLAAVAATLAATHFGYPLLWVLGSVALLAPALRGRPRAPGAAT